jgi:prepilin-type N-terminal cleavage/methylation domain-containing protein/prepilin-type processing-associated H-X9-DG protein
MNARKSASLASDGFTLVELLTVIAIVGILAAIVIPVVGSVRKSAQTSACGNNVRQISMGVILYAQDNRGLLPSARDSNGNWLGIFRGIRDPATAAAVSFSDSGSQLSNFISRFLDTERQSDIWRCPGNEPGQLATTQNGQKPNNRMSYVVNNRGQGFITNSKTSPENFFGNDEGTPEQRRPKSLLEIDNGAAAAAGSTGKTASGRYWNTYTGRANIWMITDMDSVNYSNSSSYIPAVGSDGEVPMPHGGGRNYAFFDGHVELRKANDLPANP